MFTVTIVSISGTVTFERMGTSADDLVCGALAGMRLAKSYGAVSMTDYGGRTVVIEVQEGLAFSRQTEPEMQEWARWLIDRS